MQMTNFKMKVNAAVVALVFATIFSSGITSCKQSTQKENTPTIQTELNAVITEQEVLDVQQAWSDGIVKIGKVFTENGDFKNAATGHINNFYNYQEGSVLFKPTLTTEKQFRTDFEGALSYFVGGNTNYPEDKGFALKPYSSVRWESIGMKIIGNMAVAMGNYYFTPAKGGDEIKVEYSFAYTKDKEGKLKIILHDSHIPFSPDKK
jgi:hypothetical protein